MHREERRENTPRMGRGMRQTGPLLPKLRTCLFSQAEHILGNLTVKLLPKPRASRTLGPLIQQYRENGKKAGDTGTRARTSEDRTRSYAFSKKGQRLQGKSM